MLPGSKEMLSGCFWFLPSPLPGELLSISATPSLTWKCWQPRPAWGLVTCPCGQAQADRAWGPGWGAAFPGSEAGVSRRRAHLSLWAGQMHTPGLLGGTSGLERAGAGVSGAP